MGSDFRYRIPCDLACKQFEIEPLASASLELRGIDVYSSDGELVHALTASEFSQPRGAITKFELSADLTKFGAGGYLVAVLSIKRSTTDRVLTIGGPLLAAVATVDAAWLGIVASNRTDELDVFRKIADKTACSSAKATKAQCLEKALDAMQTAQLEAEDQDASRHECTRDLSMLRLVRYQVKLDCGPNDELVQCVQNMRTDVAQYTDYITRGITTCKVTAPKAAHDTKQTRSCISDAVSRTSGHDAGVKLAGAIPQGG